jgi:RecB family exonuclease
VPLIEGHHDFNALEARLVELIREVKQGDPFAAVAVIAPTRWLLTHLRLRLAESFPGLLNVRLLHHDALAREAASAAGTEPLRTLSAPVREQVLQRAVDEVGGELAGYVARRPGTLSVLLESMNDLREAAVAPVAATRVGGLSRAGRELLRFYTAYVARLDTLLDAGLTDRAGALRSATPHVASFCRRFRLVIHYGAYDLIGVNLDLMRGVEASAARLVYLVPFHDHAPAYAHARAFWKEMLKERPTPLGGAGTSALLADRLPDLYDETRQPPALDAERIALFRTQGAGAELQEVALRILALHRDTGRPLRRIAVIARSLTPYAPILAPTFEENRLPFTSTASLGALREARVQAALGLARTVLQDFERQPLIDLCRSGLLRIGDRNVLAEADAWDRLSRDFHVTGGHAVWTRLLPHWIESAGTDPPAVVNDDADGGAVERARALKAARLERSRSLGSLVEDLHRASAPLRRARSWQGWADGMGELLDRVLPRGAAPDGGREADGAELLAGVLSDMRDLEEIGVPFSAWAALAFFERALSSASLVVSSRSVGSGADAGGGANDEGGVRVLDAMQARGLTFDATFLVGFNADLIPRRPREDPFLRDADRRLIRESLQVPLPIKASGRDEERLLLAHLLGGARDHLTISWQHADENGRARVPSLTLREVARLALGAPDLGSVDRSAVRLPGHPGASALEAARRLGLLPPTRASIGAALELGSPARVREAGGRLPLPERPEYPQYKETLASGLSMLNLIEGFDGRDLNFDASIGDAVSPPPTWSPSRLERLGACPQHYFFRHLLHVEELQDVAEGYEIEALETGRIVHAVLHDVYRELAASGLIGESASDSNAAVRRAHDLAEESWSRRARPLEARISRRYPLLWRSTSDLWRQTLRRTLAEDVAALVGARARIIALEEETRTTIALEPRDMDLDVRGRFDRLVQEGEREFCVSDYKSSGNLEPHVNLSSALKGNRLQLPLYILMVESSEHDRHPDGVIVRAEVIGTGPDHVANENRIGILPKQFEKQRRGILETLGVLLKLAAAGHYPLNSDSRLCRYCPYTAACRRSHVPTRERLEGAPAGASYEDLRRKNIYKPLLAGVAGGDRRAEDT